MKKVFSNCDQVLHLWANQTQSEARSANVFFRDTTCYSYGTHYTLGQLVKFKGKTVAVINDRGYSVTTAKHIRSAWDAVAHLPRIKSSELNVIHGLKTTRDKLQADLDALLRKKTVYNRHVFCQDSHEWEQVLKFNELCKQLKESKYCIKITPAFAKQVNKHFAKRIARQNELNSPEYLAKKEAKALKKAESEISKWREGGQLTNAVRNLKFKLLRVAGDTVQTSGGAEVPLTHAVRLLKLVDSDRARTGEKIGHFTFNGIEGDIVTIGCHKILISEAKSVLSGVASKLQLVQSA